MRYLPLALFTGAVLSAQTGDVKIDNPQARVVVVSVQPNQAATLQKASMNRVLIFPDAVPDAVSWNPAGTPWTTKIPPTILFISLRSN